VNDVVDCALSNLFDVWRAELEKILAAIAVKLRVGRYRWNKDDAQESNDGNELKQQEEELLFVESVGDGTEELKL